MPWTTIPILALGCCSHLSPLALIWGVLCLTSPRSRSHGKAILLLAFAGGFAFLLALVFLYIAGTRNIDFRALPMMFWVQAFGAGFGFIGCPAIILGIAAPWLGLPLHWLELRPQICAE
jgi:hypothetical protein